MDVLLFTAEEPASLRKRMMRQIGSVARGISTEVFTDIDALAKRLRRLPQGVDVAVLHAADDGALLKLVSVRELLEDVRIILVLPDRKKNTVIAGHLFRPRFLTYSDVDFNQVAAVLRKMADYHDKQKRITQTNQMVAK